MRIYSVKLRTLLPQTISLESSGGKINFTGHSRSVGALISIMGANSIFCARLLFRNQIAKSDPNGAKLRVSREGPRPRGPGRPGCRVMRAGGTRTPRPASLPKTGVVVGRIAKLGSLNMLSPLAVQSSRALDARPSTASRSGRTGEVAVRLGISTLFLVPARVLAR